MNLFELFVKIGVDDQASDNISRISKGLGKGLATAAKIGVAAVGAAAAGITALTKQSIESYAEFEQLVGGAELMFGDAYGTVMENAKNAYKTVQMSQNEYLQQVNGFATGLKTALGGNEQAAADLAHRIVQAEADIVAATGNTAENVQNAFNGIMKSNFTMLDNLQIGITPTKEGFQEVIKKVNAWNKANGEATKYQMGNLADMQSALVDYIDMVGMSGYAQREASETITGSLSSMKAAWTNLVTGFADDGADLDKLIGNLVDSVVGYTDESGNSVKGVLDNLLPAIEKALSGIAKLIEGAAPKIVEVLPSLVEGIIPSVISSATGIVNAFISALPDLLNMVVGALMDNAPILIESAASLVKELFTGIIKQIPQIAKLGLSLIESLAKGIEENTESIAPTVMGVISEMVDILTNPENLSLLLDTAIVLVENIATGLIENISFLAEAAIQLILGLVDFVTEPSNIEKLLNMAVNLVTTIMDGFVGAIPMLVNAAVKLILELVKFLIDPKNIDILIDAALSIVLAIATGLIEAAIEIGKGAIALIDELIKMFDETDWKQVATDIVNSLLDGLKSAWESVKTWFNGVWDSLFGNRSIDVDVNTSNDPPKPKANGLSYVPYDGYYALLHKGERVLTATENKAYSNGNGGTGGIVINQYIQSVPQTPADFASTTEAYFEQARWML